MFFDLTTIIWKEFKQIFFVGKSFGFLLRNVIFLLIFGIALPIWKREGLIYSQEAFFYWFLMTFLVTLPLSISSFISERENYSLEMLLTSRLPNIAIWLGKLIAYSLYGLACMFIFSTMNFITTIIILYINNIEIISYNVPVKNFILIGITCFCGALISSGLGLFFSIRSKNLDDLQINFKYGVIIIAIPVLILYNIIRQLYKHIENQTQSWFFIKMITALYIIILLIIMYLISNSFKRSKFFS